MLAEISWEDFRKVHIAVGTIVLAEPFPEAIKPALKLTVDFGVQLGVKRTSAQITDRYLPMDLIGKQVLGVVNLPPKQIGPFVSQFLLTGIYAADGTVVLVQPSGAVPNGGRLE